MKKIFVAMLGVVLLGGCSMGKIKKEVEKGKETLNTLKVEIETHRQYLNAFREWSLDLQKDVDEVIADVRKLKEGK